MNDAITLIHYGEISLKGRNRGVFEGKLAQNIEKVTQGKVTRYRGRLVLEGGNPQSLSHIFGISWYASAYRVKKSLDSIISSVLSRLPELTEINTFGVFVKRSDKNFSYRSMDLAERIGSAVISVHNLKVNLTNPDLSVCVEIADDVYIYFEKNEGLRGFPVDVSGNVLSLLSGGIDSPVASYLMMKRGCRVDFVHFHVYAHNDKVLDTKMQRVVACLDRYQMNSRLYLVPYYPFEQALLLHGSTQGNELVLFRRLMVRIAQRIAQRNNLQAIVTGDSLGQVASQTLENISQLFKVLDMPLFQPLITYDKQEIVDLAKKIGTYELSIESYKDCCSIVSANPKTKAKDNRIIALEEKLNMEDIIEKTMDLVTLHNY